MRKKERDHLERQRRAVTLTGNEKKALVIILLGVAVFAVSMVLMGGDTFGVQSSRERMAIQFKAWVTFNGRPVPSVTAVVGIAVAVWGVRVSNRAHARRAPDTLP